ncbi:aspartyl protease family protein, partial [Acidobacteria bacterium AH-259-L09]|nr:aspartyl protease family protein [Acidobacteria bacterium AH-259-L09]
MKSLPSWLLIGPLGSLLCSFCLARDIAHTSVPFRLYDHLIVVNGAIGELQDLNCAIDTGSSFTILDRQIAKRLKLKGRSRQVGALGKNVPMQEVVLPELHLGAVGFDSVPARVAELPHILRVRIAVLVGLNLLKRRNFTLDYEKKEIRFQGVEHSASSVPVLVRMQVKGRPLHMLLDTGAGEVILFNRRVQGRLSMRPAGEEKTILYVGGKTKLQKVYLSDVAIGGKQWKRFPAFLFDGPGHGSVNFDGALGVSSLNFRRIHFDFERNV